MIANPGKFKAIIIKKDGTDTTGTKLQINENSVDSSSEVLLLGLTIDNKLNFSKHISELCRKAASNINALKRFKRYISDCDRKLRLAMPMYCHTLTTVLWYGTSVEKVIFTK